MSIFCFPAFLPMRGAVLLVASLAIACTTSRPSIPAQVAGPEPTPAATASVAGAGKATTASEVQLVPLLDGLEHPWGMTWLPDGSLLLTERPGRLRRVRNGQLDPAPIPGVPAVLALGQGGLLDVALHPRFAENQLVYFTYAAGDRQANYTSVARARFDGNSLQAWENIFAVPQAKPGGQHFGARLAWLPDETLLVSIGDGGNPPVRLEGGWIREQAQNLESYLGKVVRLNDDGSIPEDNPTINGQRSAIWSYGHRNIQGLAYDPLADRVWASEHGARGGDELNRVQAGQNYGWPLVSHSREYTTGQPVAPTQSQPGKVDPLLVWTPAIAPSGLAVYTGDAFPAWRGQLLAGGLVSRNILRIAVSESSAEVLETIEVGQRVRDVRQGPDGLVYVLTDEPNGQLLRLEPR